jgi:putative membrane protein
MDTNQTDPRIFFAAERTLLAWLRSGLTIIGLGFVISRFGLFIQLLGLQVPSAAHADTSISTILGISFVFIGSLSIALAAIQHRRFVASLNFDQLPAIYSNKLAFALTIFVSILGFVLAGYLWIA